MWWQIRATQVNMYDDSSYYAYSSYAFCSMDAAEGLIKGWGEDGEGISEAYYYVTDAAQLENVIGEVQEHFLYQLEQLQNHRQ